ncbi:Uncharacterized protein QTN25_006938 [Entamoeba marina]
MLIQQGELTNCQFHMVVWVNKIGGDKILKYLEHFNKTPLIKTTFNQYEEWYPQYVKDKKKNHNENYETIIVLDDALSEIKNEESEIAQSLGVCRHVNNLMILFGQQTVGSILTELTSLLNAFWIFKGYTKNNIITISQSILIPFDLIILWECYLGPEKSQELICDNDEQLVFSF